jgi:hypothetical protein
MTQDSNAAPVFVIKAEDLAALNYVDPDHVQPVLVEWINRGTDKTMRRTTIDLLLRTLYQDAVSPSVVQLHQTSGLRLTFANDPDRDHFAAAFSGARAELSVRRDYHVASLFADLKQAEKVVAGLKEEGVPEAAISMLWRTEHFGEGAESDGMGHSKLSVAAATAGGGIAGALFGIGVLAMIPGVGPIAAAGAVAAAFPSFAAVSAAIGATGGAMARMLTDHDVDSRDANYFEAQIRRGRVFVSVDTRLAEGTGDIARRVLIREGGKTLARS